MRRLTDSKPHFRHPLAYADRMAAQSWLEALHARSWEMWGLSRELLWVNLSAFRIPLCFCFCRTTEVGDEQVIVTADTPDANVLVEDGRPARCVRPAARRTGMSVLHKQFLARWCRPSGTRGPFTMGSGATRVEHEQFQGRAVRRASLNPNLGSRAPSFCARSEAANNRGVSANYRDHQSGRVPLDVQIPKPV
jgi:hypothetical protein